MQDYLIFKEIINNMAQRRNLKIIIPANSKKYHGGPICISGPPGIGKSTIGRKITEKMTIPFYDLDDIVVEKVDAKTTKEIIEEKGIRYFQKLSHLCLKETMQKRKGSYVLSFGGGTIVSLKKSDLKDKNKKLVEQYAFTICILPSKNLGESVKVLWPRQSDGKRLTGVKSSKELHLYLKRRMPGYVKSADRIIYTHHASIEKIVSAVLEVLK